MKLILSFLIARPMFMVMRIIRRQLLSLPMILCLGLGLTTLTLADGGGPGFALGALGTFLSLAWVVRRALHGLLRVVTTG